MILIMLASFVLSCKAKESNDAVEEDDVQMKGGEITVDKKRTVPQNKSD